MALQYMHHLWFMRRPNARRSPEPAPFRPATATAGNGRRMDARVRLKLAYEHTGAPANALRSLRAAAKTISAAAATAAAVSSAQGKQ